MSKLSKHQEQFERLQRWYERFKKINDGQVHDKSSEFYQDEVYAFFMNCYHLKDWIIEDDAVVLASKDDKGKKKRIVENYINSVDDLKLCADICNSLKHLCLDKNRKPRSGEDPKFDRKSAKLNIGVGPIKIEMKYIIDTLSGPRDAFDIATKCIEAWGKFYSDNKLNVTGEGFANSIIR